MEPVRSPETLLQGGDGNVQATVLSVSDQHATILLLTAEDPHSDDEVAAAASSTQRRRSLLKLTVVPTHRSHLASTDGQKRCTSLAELSAAPIDAATSQRILAFLQTFHFSLTSESGAEYSYYTASEKTWWQNPWGFFFQQIRSNSKEAFKVELISPASERQIERSLPSPAMALVEETPDMYKSIVQPYIETVVAGGSLAWIQNVVDGTKEAERLLLQDDDFVLNVDTKWRTHPDAHTVPRDQWYEHPSTATDLYCLAIVKDGASLRSLRDLRGSHLPLLRNILARGRATIATVYGVPADQLRVFLHYQPQFYHLHVHFTRLENEIGCQVERGHLLADVIQNLELDGNYYSKRTISYKLKTSSELYTLIQQHQGKQQGK